MSKHRVWSTEDTIERMEECKQRMLADGEQVIDALDVLAADFEAVGNGVDEIIAKLQWMAA